MEIVEFLAFEIDSVFKLYTFMVNSLKCFDEILQIVKKVAANRKRKKNTHIQIHAQKKKTQMHGNQEMINAMDL